MKDSNANGSGGKWGSFLWALIFFAGLPVGLLNLAWVFLETQENNRLVQENFSVLDRTLYRLKQEGGDTYFVLKELNQFYGLLTEEPLTIGNVQKAYDRFKSSRLSFVKIYFFDADAEFIPFRGQKAEYLTVVKRLYSALSEPEAIGKNKLLGQYKGVFQSFLGNIEPADLVYEKGNLARVQINGKPGYFYWNTLYYTPTPGEAHGKNARFSEDASIYQGGVVAFFEDSMLPKDIALKKLVRDLNLGSEKSECYGFLDLENPRNSFSEKTLQTRFKMSFANLRKTVINMRSRFLRHLSLSSGILSVIPINPVKIVVGLKKVEGISHVNIKIIITIISAGIFLFVGIWSFRVYISGAILYIPIRRKLVSLFLYASAIPVISFILLGYQYAFDRRQVMLQEKFGELAEFVENVDENFNVAVQELQNFYKKFTKTKAVCNIDKEKLVRLGGKLKDKNYIAQAFFLNAKGEILFTILKDKAKDMATQFIPTLARKIFIGKYGSDSGDIQSKVSDVMVESFSDSVAELMVGAGSKKIFTDILEQTDKVHEFWLGRMGNFFFASFVKSLKTKETFIVIFLQGMRGFSREYLKKVVARNQNQPEESNPFRIGMISRVGTREPFPVSLSKYLFVREMGDKVMLTETQHSSIEEMGGKKYLVIASPMKKLPEYIVFSMYPESLIDSCIYKLEFKIALISFASSLFAFFIGLKLAGNFLWPIKELSIGISAIETRSFSYRIPTLADDELGDLGATLNRVIESLPQWENRQPKNFAEIKKRNSL